MGASGDGPRVPASGERRSVPFARFRAPAIGPPARDAGGTAAPPAGGAGNSGAGGTGNSGADTTAQGTPDRPPDSRRAAIWLAATFVGAVGIAVGNDLTTVFAHSPVLFIVVLAVVTIAIGALYFFSDMRDRLRSSGSAEIGTSENNSVRIDTGATAVKTDAASTGQAERQPPPTAKPDRDRAPRRTLGADNVAEPSPAVRWWLIVFCVALAMSVTFAYGFWVLGNGFAHSSVLGVWGLVSVVVVLAVVMLLARWLRRAPGWLTWLTWLRAWRNGVLAIGVSAIGLSSGATLGYAQLLPGPVPAVPCPAPTELRVLAASEALGPLQAAITDYEQAERSRFASFCYAVDITAYAAGNDKAADDGIVGGWNLADGPRPDVWVPASTEELPVKTSPADDPVLDPHDSIATSPVVVAVPSRLVTPALAQYERNHSLSDIYEAIKGSLTLQVPNPRLSETARLGIANLYPALSQAEQAQIGDSVSFPTDSGNLLCQSAPTTPTAYLVSNVTVRQSNDGVLGASTCPGQQAAQGQLTAFSPANGNGVVLDFPYTTVTWRDAKPSAAKTHAEQDFFNWLTSPAGVKALTGQGLNPPGLEPSLPSPDAVDAAVSGFTKVQPSARILIAIDDSLPMRPYLGQIAQATNAVLGPNGQGGNLSGRDSFGIWAFPSPAGATEKTLVPLGTESTAQRGRVPAAVTGIAARGHSAEFDLVYDAAVSLSSRPPAGSASSLVILTDGDNQASDPGGKDMAAITNLLAAQQPGSLPIKVYVIAFGPAGCAETPSGLSGDSLNALAKAGGGTCANAASGSLQQQLAQDISALSTGG
ncbi:MAG TPA: substrate-binding domain-containing protein [Trebonia sp.]